MVSHAGSEFMVSHATYEMYFAGMVDVLRSNTIISSNKAQIIVKVCNIFEQLFNLNNIT
jgi:citrate lyase synthetase